MLLPLPPSLPSHPPKDFIGTQAEDEEELAVPPLLSLLSLRCTPAGGCWRTTVGLSQCQGIEKHCYAKFSPQILMVSWEMH